MNFIKRQLKRFKNWIIFAVLGVGVCMAAGQVLPFTPEEIKWKEFTVNLENISYKHQGKEIKDLKNKKGIWQPETENDFEEIYKYVYGFDMVNWQLPDGTPMCGVGREATNCVPHWKQEFENAKFKNELNKIRKKEVNANIYNSQLISKNKIYFNFLKKWIKGVIAGVEFQDEFTEGTLTLLENHTPTTAGSGWTEIYDYYGDDYLRILQGSNSVTPNTVASGGVLYEGDDTMSGVNYTVQYKSINGDTLDDTNQLCCRIQDVDNMYCLLWNEVDADLYINNAGSWSTIDTTATGIADNSIIELICEGTSISVEDDDVEILSAINAVHSSAGKSGIGMGGLIIGSQDMSSQNVDDFVVTVSGAPPADTCTYGGSGDWDVLESDNCYITSDVYVDGKINLIGGATGQFGCADGVKVSAENFNFGGGTTFDMDCFAHH
ncbi:hypothetical protein KAR28_06225 [Candidatus Parcubacteria bacterium]|nr:hypothetical protein [Candidatus Parcubacteria bacterium]